MCIQRPLFDAYLAGFLDGDGSIYVRLKPNATYKYGFQVAPSVVFFQKISAEKYFKQLQKELSLGYLRYRKDGIIEYTIGDRPSIKILLERLLPYLILKQKQAKLMLKILEFSKVITSARDFLKLASMIDTFEKHNYSKKRVIHAEVVRHHLLHQGIVTP